MCDEITGTPATTASEIALAPPSDFDVNDSRRQRDSTPSASLRGNSPSQW